MEPVFVIVFDVVFDVVEASCSVFCFVGKEEPVLLCRLFVVF